MIQKNRKIIRGIYANLICNIIQPDFYKVHCPNLGPYSEENPKVCIHCYKRLNDIELIEKCTP